MSEETKQTETQQAQPQFDASHLAGEVDDSQVRELNARLEQKLETPAETQTPPPAQQVAQAQTPNQQATPARDPNVMAQGLAIGIPPSVVNSMSDSEIRIAIATITATKATAPAQQQTPPPAQKDTLAEMEDKVKKLVDDPNYDPTILAPVVALLEQTRAMKEELSRVKEETTRVASAATHNAVAQRVGAIVNSHQVDFNSFTESEQNSLFAFLGAHLQSERATGQMIDEPTRVQRALIAIGKLSPAQAALSAEKARYAQNSLSQPSSGKVTPNVLEATIARIEAARREREKNGVPATMSTDISEN